MGRGHAGWRCRWKGGRFVALAAGWRRLAAAGAFQREPVEGKAVEACEGCSRERLVAWFAGQPAKVEAPVLLLLQSSGVGRH